MKRDKIAQLGRDEHEDREGVRRMRKKQRGFKKPSPKPRSIRAHRYADTPEGPSALSSFPDSTKEGE